MMRVVKKTMIIVNLITLVTMMMKMIARMQVEAVVQMVNTVRVIVHKIIKRKSNSVNKTPQDPRKGVAEHYNQMMTKMCMMLLVIS
jgi:hypothetical protein